MRTLKYILQKEFRQIFRNRTMIPIIFGVPVVQLLVLAYAVTFEIRNINLVIVNKDHSSASNELIAKFSAPKFYHITNYSQSYKSAEEYLKSGKANQILVIPDDFEKDIYTTGKTNVQIVTNAIDGAAAALMNAYAQSIISDYNNDILTDLTRTSFIQPLQITQSYWYNPQLNYKNFMVPGILVLLVTIISMFLSAMNIVREKEMGTIEQMNVTPVKKYQFIAGKLIPFWIIALFELAFGLFLAKLIFNIPIVGNLGLIFGVASVYLLAALGVGLFISTLVETQQQAMFIAWFFAVVFIMLSGLFTPIENMPQWAIELDKINPIAYFIKMIRMIMLKGAGFSDIASPFAAVSIYAVAVLSLAVWQYRKTA